MKTDIINAIAKQTVTWSTEDLERLLEENGIEPTQENVLKLVSSHQFIGLQSSMIQAGIEYLNYIVGEIFE